MKYVVVSLPEDRSLRPSPMLAAIRPRPAANAFCGFYVAQGRFQAVQLSRRRWCWRATATQTAITMASDYEGDAEGIRRGRDPGADLHREEADRRCRIPRPSTSSMHYTAPRLVEYHRRGPVPSADSDGTGRLTASAANNGQRPAHVVCGPPEISRRHRSKRPTTSANTMSLILSAQESDGLVNFLNDNKLQAFPPGPTRSARQLHQAEDALLHRQGEPGAHDEAWETAYLRPLQVRYDTREVHAAAAARHRQRERPAGPDHLRADQERPRTETTNYRTVKLPSDIDVPLYVKNDFGQFLQGDVRARRLRKREHARGVRRICLGHGLVRSRAPPNR